MVLHVPVPVVPPPDARMCAGTSFPGIESSVPLLRELFLCLALRFSTVFES